MIRDRPAGSESTPGSQRLESAAIFFFIPDLIFEPIA
jgi:hypothetical protein